MNDSIGYGEIDPDTTLRHLAPLDLDDSSATTDPRRVITARDWLSLGVLCVTAAEQARSSGSHVLAKRYAVLANKCDRMAEGIE